VTKLYFSPAWYDLWGQWRCYRWKRHGWTETAHPVPGFRNWLRGLRGDWATAKINMGVRADRVMIECGRFRMRCSPAYRQAFADWWRAVEQEGIKRGKQTDCDDLPSHLPNIFWEEGFQHPTSAEDATYWWMREFQKGLTPQQALDRHGYIAWGDLPPMAHAGETD